MGRLLVETGYIINQLQLQLLFLENVLLLCYGHPLRPSLAYTPTLFFTLLLPLSPWMLTEGWPTAARRSAETPSTPLAVF